MDSNSETWNSSSNKLNYNRKTNPKLKTKQNWRKEKKNKDSFWLHGIVFSQKTFRETLANELAWGELASPVGHTLTLTKLLIAGCRWIPVDFSECCMYCVWLHTCLGTSVGSEDSTWHPVFSVTVRPRAGTRVTLAWRSLYLLSRLVSPQGSICHSRLCACGVCSDSTSIF